MKNIFGLVLLAVGVGLTAGFGSVLSPEFRETTIKDAEVSFADAEVKTTHEAYCEARENYKLPPADGCAGSEPLVSAATALSKVAHREAQLNALNESKDVLVLPVSQARTQHRLAIRKSLKRLRQREGMGTQAPGPRLKGWLNAGGVGFGIGFFFLVLGAWLCRAAQTSDGDAAGDQQDGLMDFGELLDDVVERVDGLHQDMLAIPRPVVSDLDGFKVRLEEIQKTSMARLCASGPRAQARYGIEGMAAIFSPLSSAERKMNRAWAAFVDVHWPEALASVGSARSDLESTQGALSRLT